jgi:tRNA splicing endonuclease
MTRQEKKALRLQLAQEKKLAIKAFKEDSSPQQQQNQKQKQQQQQQATKKRKASQLEPTNGSDVVTQEQQPVEDPLEAPLTNTTTPSTTTATTSTSTSDEPSSRYHQLSLNQETLEEELAEFSGDRREGVPPVMLSPPVSLCASTLLLPSLSSSSTSSPDTTSRGWIQYDHDLSERWATLLKESMLPAISVRQNEDMRPMAYQLTPEPWTRLRPVLSTHQRLETGIHPTVFDDTPNAMSDVESHRFAELENIFKTPGQTWVRTTCRPPSPLDVATAVVFEYLFKETSYHVSCGAKFGSDFLVYDGPRSQRHAFAGLRVLLPTKDTQNLPLPSAYEMAGYVRCLNTAGKLALLATVVEERTEDGPPIYRVAFVDMALEKILTAPTHQKYGRTEKRRDISRTLAKNK